MKKLISKSKFVSYYECPKRYYLSVNHPELAVIPDAVKVRLEAGTKIGDLAMGLFGDYVDVTTITEAGTLDLKAMVSKTYDNVQSGTINICEAAFLYDDLYCAVDILHKTNDGYEIYEVKSTTSVEEYHLIDSAFQKYVLTKLRYNITRVNIVTLNNSYIRDGELNINELFKINDVTELIKNYTLEIPNILPKIRLTREAKIAPEIKLSNVCDGCSFKDYCFKHIPYPSVFDIANSRKKYTYYNEGIVTFNDLCNSKYYKKLTPKAKTQIDHELNNLPIKIDTPAVKEFLNSITYPLYLIDFETIIPAIPLYDKTKPYQHIPFQYSLHYMLEPNGPIYHKEYLATEGINPTYEFALKFIQDVPRDTMIMVYNDSFEKPRLKELSVMYPDLYEEIDNRVNNIIDLMIPFQKHYIYKKEFKGSYSIKYVLPGLFPNDPELDYSNLDIVHNGGEAMSIYENLETYPEEERLKIRAALLKYCELDTYAMVKILNKLYELVKD